MRLQKLFFALMFLVLASLSLQAEEKASIKGVYKQISGQQFKFDGKTVDVIEFMSFYCDGCYAFEKSIPIIKGNFPKKIKWKTIPIYWGKGSPKPGEAYLLAEESGKGEKMKEAIFNAHFVGRKNIGDVKVLEGIGKELGLGFDFSKKLRAGDKANDVQKALDMAAMYGIDETPTVIIAGNIMTNPHVFNHDINAFRENVITILRTILK